MISNLISKRTDREFETLIDSLIKLLVKLDVLKLYSSVRPMQLQMAVLVLSSVKYRINLRL